MKSLEVYQDHLVEDGFFAIEEYKKEWVLFEQYNKFTINIIIISSIAI